MENIFTSVEPRMHTVPEFISKGLEKGNNSEPSYTHLSLSFYLVLQAFICSLGGTVADATLALLLSCSLRIKCDLIQGQVLTTSLRVTHYHLTLPEGCPELRDLTTGCYLWSYQVIQNARWSPHHVLGPQVCRHISGHGQSVLSKGCWDSNTRESLGHSRLSTRWLWW